MAEWGRGGALPAPSWEVAPERGGRGPEAGTAARPCAPCLAPHAPPRAPPRPAQAGGVARTDTEAFDKARALGYPVMVRPSYVLGGRAMEIVYSDEDLKRCGGARLLESRVGAV